jgi:hypothetical protein
MNTSELAWVSPAGSRYVVAQLSSSVNVVGSTMNRTDCVFPGK